MDISNYEMIGQGNTAEIYKIDENKILKLFRNGLSESIVIAEYNNTKNASELLKNVPKVYELVDVDNRKGIVYEKINGKDMLKAMLSQVFKLKRNSKDFAKIHYRMHKTVEKDMTSVKDKLIDDINNVDLLDDKYKNKVIKYLETLPDGDKLCHFDFHPGNIMFTDDNYYIIDWMTACKGDSLADVARTSIMLKYAQISRVPIIVAKIALIFENRIYKHYIKEYLSLSNNTIEDVEKWELPIAAARLREWIPQGEKEKLIRFVKSKCDELD